VSLDRFELLELRGDDGIQTYHAREVATARPVQVHLFAQGQTRDALALLGRLAYLPDAERRRVIDRGAHQGVPFLVTERLTGFASLREWIERNAAPSLDEQFAQLFEDELVEDQPPEPSKKASPWSPVLGLVFGVGAALLFLVLMIAFVAFRPH